MDKPLRLSQSGLDVAAVDRNHMPGRALGPCEHDEGIGDMPRLDFRPQEVACHVGRRVDAPRGGPSCDHVGRQQAGADAVGIDPVHADALAAKLQRELAQQEEGRGLGQAIGGGPLAGIDRLFRNVEQDLPGFGPAGTIRDLSALPALLGA